MVHYSFISKSMVEQGTNQANRRGHISEKRHSSKRASDRSFRTGVPEEGVATRGGDSCTRVIALELVQRDAPWGRKTVC